MINKREINNSERNDTMNSFMTSDSVSRSGG